MDFVSYHRLSPLLFTADSSECCAVNPLNIRKFFHMCFAVVQEPQQIVSSIRGIFDSDDKAVDTFDVLVCGGTLGIFIATALSSKGLRVGIVERNILKGVYTVLWSSS